MITHPKDLITALSTLANFYHIHIEESNKEISVMTTQEMLSIWLGELFLIYTAAISVSVRESTSKFFSEQTNKWASLTLCAELDAMKFSKSDFKRLFNERKFDVVNVLKRPSKDINKYIPHNGIEVKLYTAVGDDQLRVMHVHFIIRTINKKGQVQVKKYKVAKNLLLNQSDFLTIISRIKALYHS